MPANAPQLQKQRNEALLNAALKESSQRLAMSELQTELQGRRNFQAAYVSLRR